MIPKIIWQTHEPEYLDLKNNQLNVIHTWENLNPDWEHKYVSSKSREKDIESFDSFLYECYKASSGVNQADIWRLVTIYNNGGFYADMDSICLMTLDDLLLNDYNNQEMICTPPGYQTDSYENCSNNSNFAAVKNSTIIKSMLDKIILEYKKEKIMLEAKGSSLNSLVDGYPCWQIFCDICSINKDKILFNKDYVKHCHDFKDKFEEDIVVLYKGQKIKYSTLSISNNWNIY